MSTAKNEPILQNIDGFQGRPATATTEACTQAVFYEVMGRRGDKLRYLLRLLLPSQTWLRDYYRLSDTQNIAVHYLLHPLKLMVHYLAEVVTTVL
jgi:hypothetical protein